MTIDDLLARIDFLANEEKKYRDKCDRVWRDLLEARKELSCTEDRRDDDDEITIKNQNRTIEELRGLVNKYRFDWEDARIDLVEERKRADKAESGWEEALNRAKDAEVAHAGCKSKTELVGIRDALSAFTKGIVDNTTDQWYDTVPPVKQWCRRPGPPGYAPCTREKHETGPCAHPDVHDANPEKYFCPHSIWEKCFCMPPPKTEFRWWIVQAYPKGGFCRVLARCGPDARILGSKTLGYSATNLIATPL